MGYKVFRNNLGVVDAINRTPDGAFVPLADPANPLTIEYQQWKAENPDFDDADHPEDAQPIAPDPDWRSFRLAMVSDAGYNRIAAIVAASNPLLINRLENEVRVETTYLPFLELLWNQMIAGLVEADKPTTEELAGWNAIASSSHMRFSFGSDGMLQID